MKLSYGSIIFVLAILAAVVMAGCTFSKEVNIGTSATPTSGAHTGTATPAATSTATTPAASGPALDFNSLKMLEYKISSVADGETTTMNLRYEFEATQIKMKMSVEGMQPMEMTIPKDQASTSSQQGSGALGEAMSTDFNSKLVSAGPDTVTVPKGTFLCTKYTVTDGDTKGTYWIAPNVPLPIKMVQEEKGAVVSTMELVDYQV